MVSGGLDDRQENGSANDGCNGRRDRYPEAPGLRGGVGGGGVRSADSPCFETMD